MPRGTKATNTSTKSTKKAKPEPLARLPSTGAMDSGELFDYFLGDQFEENFQGEFDDQDDMDATNESAQDESLFPSSSSSRQDAQVPEVDYNGWPVEEAEGEDYKALLSLDLADLMPPTTPEAFSETSPSSNPTDEKTVEQTDGSKGKTKSKRKITPKRQERNRDSARKFRARRKQYLQNLEDEVRRNRQRLQELQSVVNKTEEELHKVVAEKTILEKHIEELKQKEQREEQAESFLGKRSAEDESILPPSKHVMTENSLPSIQEPIARQSEPIVRPQLQPQQQQQVPELSPVTIFKLVTSPQFRALALMLFAAVVVTFAYGPELSGLNLPIAQISLSELQQRWTLTNGFAPAYIPPSIQENNHNDIFFGPEEHLNAHMARIFGSTAQTAALGFLLMTMYDPLQEKFKPYLVAL